MKKKLSQVRSKVIDEKKNFVVGKICQNCPYEIILNVSISVEYQ